MWHPREGVGGGSFNKERKAGLLPRAVWEGRDLGTMWDGEVVAPDIDK